MTKIKATPEMIAAVRAVQPSERKAAAKLAEKTFLEGLKKLTTFGDFSEAENIEMAGMAAAAEVTYMFA